MVSEFLRNHSSQANGHHKTRPRTQRSRRKFTLHQIRLRRHSPPDSLKAASCQGNESRTQLGGIVMRMEPMHSQLFDGTCQTEQRRSDKLQKWMAAGSAAVCQNPDRCIVCRTSTMLLKSGSSRAKVSRRCRIAGTTGYDIGGRVRSCGEKRLDIIGRENGLHRPGQ